jgi:hypothetical protein
MHTESAGRLTAVPRGVGGQKPAPEIALKSREKIPADTEEGWATLIAAHYIDPFV